MMGICKGLRENDDLAIIRHFMKFTFCWPENQQKWQRIMSVAIVLPFYFIDSLVLLFVILEIKREDPVKLLQGFSDFLGCASILYRGSYIRHHANTILEISKLLSELKKLEADTIPVRIKIPKVVWIPTVLHGSLVSCSFVACIIALIVPNANRELTMRIPYLITDNVLLFYPIVAIFAVGHYGIIVNNIASESILICMTTIMRERAKTLNRIIQNLRTSEDQTYRKYHLSKSIKYHIIICDLHNNIEALISRPMLLHLFFSMIAFGTPAMTILLVHDLGGANGLAFSFFYIVWVPSQLLVYFLMCDAATDSAQGIGYEAYSAYKPDMIRDEVTKLMIIMARADRPLYLTARKFIKINRNTLVKLVKQSYSFYSAILSLR